MVLEKKDNLNLFNLLKDNMASVKEFFIKTFGWDYIATNMDGGHHFATNVLIDEYVVCQLSDNPY
ncbi:MAG: hypothetical protein ACFFCV_01860 [Promethearchaeota archaeon]